MSTSQSNWLAALLFPLKIYTLFAGIILFCWHANLPPNQTDLRSNIPVSSRYADPAWFAAATDFSYMAHFVWLGYFFCAVVLISGGAIQFYKVSRKAGSFSIVFGLAALIIGLVLTSYARPHLQAY